jgi:hypothetical protein
MWRPIGSHGGWSRVIGHAHDLIGDAVGLLFILIAGPADGELGLDRLAKRPIAERAPNLCEWLRAEWSGRRGQPLIWLWDIGCQSLHKSVQSRLLLIL